MDFRFTEEQKQIKALIKQFCKKEVDINLMWELSDKAAKSKTLEEMRAIQPLGLVRKLHDVGLRQLAVPTKYGGGGVTVGGNLTRSIASEETGYSMAIGCRLLTTPWNHCAAMAGRHTTEEQKDWFFTQFMENPTMQVGTAISEPSGMTDLSLPYDEPGVAIKTIAHKDGNEWVINGDKMFSSAGGAGGMFLVGVRTDKTGPITTSFSVFWVPTDTPGVTQVPNRFVAGEISGNVQTYLENVRVPESNLIWQVNKGMEFEADYLVAKMIHYSNLLGQAQSLYENIRNYAKERVVGGKPIIQHANIEVQMGEAALSLDAARAFMYQVAWENDQRELAGAPPNLYWSLAFYSCVKKLCWRLLEIASDIYGGIGGSIDLPVEKFLRRVFTFMPTGGGTYSILMMKCSRYYDTSRFEV